MDDFESPGVFLLKLKCVNMIPRRRMRFKELNLGYTATYMVYMKEKEKVHFMLASMAKHSTHKKGKEEEEVEWTVEI